MDFGPATNVLVGENDSGKTAIIDAIRLCLLTTAADFYRITRDECSGAPLGLDFVPLIATDSAEGTHDFVPARRGFNMMELMPGRQHIAGFGKPYALLITEGERASRLRHGVCRSGGGWR
ncbi:AAA family ATPase [Streptomyces doebereineriae]|uniref:AAA family ATPase n=1 Tax=Streptomyces doebereineriae TaxID=3075528 RepID=UPI00374E1322